MLLALMQAMALGRMHEALHAWDSQILRKPKCRLKKAQKDLEKSMNGPISDECGPKAKEMDNRDEHLLEQDEITRRKGLGQIGSNMVIGIHPR
jgi:hypothetical protein